MLTSRFAFVHIPRTGGSTLRTFLGNIPGAKVISAADNLTHAAMRRLYRRWARFDNTRVLPPAFAFVRHPAAWYVSHWCWMSHSDDYGIKGISFFEFMESVAAGALKGYGPTGSFTGHWQRLGADRCQHIGRFENYQVEVVRILRAIIPDLITTDTIRAKIQAAGYVRRVPRPDGQLAGPWRQYYNDRWLRRVVGWDGRLMERFGYRI